ncbi:MAG: exodeoxyribonuclease VII small subunit [Sphaerochaetaceae bacterium]|jgi:exodeoxyribonuclease VII small subunit|nr:exodeoxyribonuclease VII small subunit [Sphaerochaetaceae bacterium]MDC7237870.1 exodeoxyribonuclease VII small subunit [Sphaerochaetaceae bacterium]MDC7248776.1 exodeoxyribonuclease VII small subunit [Sphaerochaetaceae bacterium]
MDFEKKLNRMEEIAQALRNNETPLEKSIELYEEGMLLSKELEKSLDNAKRRIEIVKIQDESEIETEEFGDF